MRKFHRALAASGKIHDLMELGRSHFARGMDERLALIPAARDLTSENM